ncbi:hypothetical protein BCV72DRAFT_263125 [Rhizopus microsporus var. microsporus]|uniref:Uncharacterized protein n=2 Tax=Rhizopus microsporus TaxID=58291 RepID=A0A2G4T9C0_RHIZD|nr:uncharacterized protein RHIMIDRAFT_288455 [Rhizopus microsporus ATCC 52813]ORE05831.1 hypothetical protein BCV72DRAFT_263125 [Rhizopus microsporus var. microsporus]PHZ17598.1 hypothetical protein RHIMIDRAFT_288455 [Rhizopus microsporus ATCC 52813]
MYDLLERAYKNKFPVPPQCLTEEYSFETRKQETVLTGSTNFKDSYGSIVWQDKLWKTLFNIKHVKNKRRKPNEEYKDTNIELDYGWKTDGYMVAVLFKRKTVGK